MSRPDKGRQGDGNNKKFTIPIVNAYIIVV